MTIYNTLTGKIADRYIQILTTEYDGKVGR